MPRFSQQVINALANPSYGMLTGQALANTGERMSQIPGNIRAEEERQRLLQEKALLRKTGQEGVAAFGSGDFAGMNAAGATMAGLGDPTTGMAFAQAAKTEEERLKAEAAFKARKDAMVTRATTLGLSTEVVNSIKAATTDTTLDALAGDLRKRELDSLPQLSDSARRSVLKGAGYTEAQAIEIVDKKPSKQEFEAYRDLQKGEVEMYLDSSGKPVTYRTTEYGMVVKDNQMVDPSTLGLTKAPNQQVIKNVTSTMGSELAKRGAEAFEELYTQAGKAREGIISIDNVMGDIDTMFTGTTANVELGVKKFLNDIGISVDPEGVMATEVFMAESAKRIAEYITNLGAGTGLSDKDLEFTQKVVAGNVTLSADTIKRVLEEYKAAAIRKIEGYNSIRSTVQGRLGAENEAALDLYSVITVPQQGNNTNDFDALWNM